MLGGLYSLSRPSTQNAMKSTDERLLTPPQGVITEGAAPPRLRAIRLQTTNIKRSSEFNSSHSLDIPPEPSPLKAGTHALGRLGREYGRPLPLDT